MTDVAKVAEAKFPGWEVVEKSREGTVSASAAEAHSMSLADMQRMLGVPAEEINELVAASQHLDDETEIVVMRPVNAPHDPEFEKLCVFTNGRLVAVQG